MYFEVAGISVSPWIPPLVAFIVSAFTSSSGVSGAFLILPFQISVLGFTGPAVSATNQLYAVLAIPGGAIRFIREGRMVWQLVWLLLIGTIPGILIGTIIRLSYLPNPEIFKYYAGAILFLLSVKLIYDQITNKNCNMDCEAKFRDLMKDKYNHDINALPKPKIIEYSKKQLVVDFFDEIFVIPTLKVLISGLLVGIAGGAYGIGGGAILATVCCAFFSLPVYITAGPVLLTTMITSFIGLLCYIFLAPYYPALSVKPDWMLGFLFGIGGLAGIYVGARLQKYMPSKVIKTILGLSILLIALKYLIKF